MPEVRCFDSISAINRDAWNLCFPNELENYNYLLAVERARIKDFELRYYVVMDGDTVLAATPAFYVDYDLATTADGKVRRILLAAQRIAPKLFTLKLACLASFATKSCPICYHPCFDKQKKRE